MGAVVDREGGRRADLAAIHIAKKALGWDEDTYRDVMFTVTCFKSAGKLDFAGRKRFMAHLQACMLQQGLVTKAKAARAPGSPSPRRLWSLWQQLADAKLVTTRDRKALDAWVHRQTGVDRLEWLNEAQLDLVITSAKQWLSRKGEA